MIFYVRGQAMVMGIDIGGTTTDIVGYKDGEILSPLSVQAGDPITSATGAIGKFLNTMNIPLSVVRKVGVTGVGATYIKGDLLGIPSVTIDEFTSIGNGGIFLSKIIDAIVVSMGTGTALVEVKDKKIFHWGGSGVGGGTLIGLSKKLLKTDRVDIIIRKAEKGSLEKVDLTVGDIVAEDFGDLPGTATASNFGKMSDDASEDDIALALINLVCQTIGVIAVGAARATGKRDIVLTGKLTRIPQTRELISRIGELYSMNFHIPDRSEYATAIGAAISVGESGDK
jgi:type II pantothenate kinase